MNNDLLLSEIKNLKNLIYELNGLDSEDINKGDQTMPKDNTYKTHGVVAHIRERCDERYLRSFEIRYRKNGYNISASATTLQEAKRRFSVKLLHSAQSGKHDGVFAIPRTFNGFAEYWLYNFHRRKVCAETYRIANYHYEKNLKHLWKNVPIKKITACDIQPLIDGWVEEGKGKKADDIFSLLNQIFKASVKFGLVNYNPCDMVFHKTHARKHGTALTKAEEVELLAKTQNAPYGAIFAVLLYSGLRPNELKTVVIKENMIIAQNSKRKGGKIEFKRIPINRMLSPFVGAFLAVKLPNEKKLSYTFHQLFPTHKLYDLRTTFYTRCCECGVADKARDEMVGHSGGTLYQTYADLSDEYLTKEADKIFW